PGKELVYALERPAAHPPGHGEVLLDRQRREHFPCLGHVPDAGAVALERRLPRERPAPKRHLPGMERRMAHDGREERRLPHAVPSEHRERPTTLERETDALENHR